MKEKLHVLFSCVMALLLLVSTTSWTVSKHYCMGHLIDVSLFANAEDCGMDIAMHDDNTTKIQEVDSCCSDELLTVEGQDDLRISFNDFNIDQKLVFIAFAHSCLNLFEGSEQRPVANEHYPPPLLIKNIHVLDEVFLI